MDMIGPLTYETFDLFHLQHGNQLKRARELERNLIVGLPFLTIKSDAANEKHG